MSAIQITIPQHIHDEVKALANGRREIRGIFVCSQEKRGRETVLRVKGFVKLAVGEPHQVRTHPLQVRAANALVERLRRTNPSANYRLIDFHTHCRGTGMEWFNKFSGGDADTIANHLLDDKAYIHLLYTPTHVLPAGHPNNMYQMDIRPTNAKRDLGYHTSIKALHAAICREHGTRPVT